MLLTVYVLCLYNYILFHQSTTKIKQNPMTTNSYGIHTILIENNRHRIVKRMISQTLGHNNM
jgi:hypothetical protein